MVSPGGKYFAGWQPAIMSDDVGESAGSLFKKALSNLKQESPGAIA